HGAALYWQHNWDGELAGVESKFPLIAHHVLLPSAGPVAAEAAWLRAGLKDATIDAAIAATPESWWADPGQRPAFAARLRARRHAASRCAEEADRARALCVRGRPRGPAGRARGVVEGGRHSPCADPELPRLQPRPRPPAAHRALRRPRPRRA